MAPFLANATERQYALLLWLHAATGPYRATAIPAVVDADIATAATSLAATLETAERGIIYDHPAATVAAQRLADEYRKAIAHIEGDRPGRLGRDAAAALRALARLTTDLSKKDSLSKAAVELLDRLVGPRSRADAEGPELASEDTKPKIVLS